MTEVPKVYLVEDDEVLSSSLEEIISSIGIDVETYGTGNLFLSAHDPEVPGCIVLDIRLPEKSGLAVQNELREMGSKTPVIIMSGHADVSVAVQAMKLGAVDVLIKPFTSQVLIDAIQKHVELDVGRHDEHADRTAFFERYASLTRRQRAVFDLLVVGTTNKEIATRLGISVKTVEVHRGAVMNAMQNKRLASLVAEWVKYRDLDPVSK